MPPDGRVLDPVVAQIHAADTGLGSTARKAAFEHSAHGKSSVPRRRVFPDSNSEKHQPNRMRCYSADGSATE